MTSAHEWNDEELSDWIGKHVFVTAETKAIWKELRSEGMRERTKEVLHGIRNSALNQVRTIRDNGGDNRNTRLYVNEIDFRLSNIRKAELKQVIGKGIAIRSELKALVEDLSEYLTDEGFGDHLTWEVNLTPGISAECLCDWLNDRKSMRGEVIEP